LKKYTLQSKGIKMLLQKFTNTSRPVILATATGLLSATVILAGCVFEDSDKKKTATFADTVFQNGYVYTINSTDSVAESVAIKDGLITFVGSNEDVKAHIDSNTRVIDLEGHMLMPGFVDAHVHSIGGGRAAMQCNLAYAPLSIPDMQAAIQTCLDNTRDKEPSGWLEVVNWDKVSANGVTVNDLDLLTTSRPIAITSTDFHTVLANRAALAAAGITADTPDPAGGSFEHFIDGEPNGLCQDNAGFQLKAAIPADTDADLVEQARVALSNFADQGVTTFMDAAAGESTLTAFRSLKDAGDLTARANFAMSIDTAEATSAPSDVIAGIQAQTANNDGISVQPGLNIRVVKIFMDGVVNAPTDTGAMLFPYYENVGTEAAPDWQLSANSGSLYFTQDALTPLLLAAADAGIDPHIHATGERAVQVSLNAIEAVRQQRPDADFRPAIAHDETVAEVDYPRFAALDTTATFSFQWAVAANYSIGETEHHLGADRFARMEPFGSLHNNGARIAYGSDWPIDPYDIFLALKAGVTRSGDPTNPNSPAALSPEYEGPINADPALSRAETLRAITMISAYHLRMENEIGSLEVGKYADMIVLDKNFMTAADEDLARNSVLLTMVAGRIVKEDGLSSIATASTPAFAKVKTGLDRSIVHSGGDGHGH
jgi:predicted amidohydrolase YtcJ